MTSPEIRSIVGVSIPRSGHHYLQSLLQAVLDGDLSYCEFYSAQECCRSVPCTVRPTTRFRYQKGHDLDLALPVDLPDVLYLVQYRDPVAEAVSDRELFLSATGFVTPPTADQYTHWLAGKVRYLDGFFAKWLRNPMPSVLAIDYDRLVADPAGVVEDICNRLGAPHDRRRIEEAIADHAGIARRPPIVTAAEERVAFVPRRIEESVAYVPELLAEYEAAVLARVPELAAKRRLSRPDVPRTALSALVEAGESLAGGDREAARRRLTEALAAWPDNAYVHLALGRLEAAGGAVAAREALAAFERAAHHSPADPEILFLLADAYRGAGERDAAVGVGSRIVAELPASVGHRLFLAVLLSEAGRDDEAVQEAEHARDLGLTDPHHHALYRQVSEQAALRRA